MKWISKIRDTASGLWEKYEKHFTIKGFFLFLIFLYCAIPDWKGRNEFWSSVLRLDAIAWFLLSGWGKLIVMAICGVGIWLDHRAVLAKRTMLVTAPATPAPVIDSEPENGGAVTEALDSLFKKKPEPAANVIFVSCQIIDVTYHYDVDEIGERLSSSGRYEETDELLDNPEQISTVAIASFRNEPVLDRKIKSAWDVRAQLVFRDAIGNELGHGVSRACWLGRSGGDAGFGVGDSHRVILAILRNDGTAFSVPWKQRQSHGVFSTEWTSLQRNVSQIEVRLLDNSDDLITVASLRIAPLDGQPHIEKTVAIKRL